MPQQFFSHFQEHIWPRLGSTVPHVRLPVDTVPGQPICVYKYMTKDFLRLAREQQLSTSVKKHILKAALEGIAALHDCDVVHLGIALFLCFLKHCHVFFFSGSLELHTKATLDIKPDNIMVNYHLIGQETEIQQVELIDFENAAYLPNGRCVKGMLHGNENWRSPEGHFMGELNKPADIFSFALVV